MNLSSSLNRSLSPRALGAVCFLSVSLALAAAPAAGPQGYYRFPAIHGDTIVFTAEGDLWTAAASGGTARRLTSHAATELGAAISPDGATVAFSASYEGPLEVYTMPLEGGLPARRTWDGEGSFVTGWTPDGRVMYTTDHYTGLPDFQTVLLDPRTGQSELLPLAQASGGVFDQSGDTLFFTRLSFQGSQTKRYQGGTAQSIWRYTKGGAEAVPLTADWKGTSRTPMLWNGRLYFASDRDGTMNIWSMDLEGRDLKQHTKHSGWDALSPSLSDGRIVYQCGADLWLLDLKSGADAVVPIRLASDLDQMRERWVKPPMDFVTSVYLAPKGDRVALTARGQIFVAPAEQGRLVEATRAPGVRYREARFMPDGKTLLALSDVTGEVELARLPANGVGRAETLTTDGHVLRWEAVPSPDGKWIAHHDKNRELWLLNVESKANTRIATCPDGDFSDLEWSPDSRWLAYVAPGTNTFDRIWLYGIESRAATAFTTDRYDSRSPAWSPDGKWLYFLSDRNLESVVRSPWGSRQPEPFFDRQSRLYETALVKGLRSPFQPGDELAPEEKKDDDKGKEADKDSGKEPDKAKSADKDDKKDGKDAKGGKDKKEEPPKVVIELEGLIERTREVPVPPGNYNALSNDGKHLYFVSRDAGVDRKSTLKSLAIENKGAPPDTVLEDIKFYDLSLDRKKILVQKGNDVLVFDASGKPPADTAKATVNLRDWMFSLDPREEWRQMFVEAWRLERDYFYDRGMHGVDWKAMRDKYLPLVDRVTDRGELSNLLAQMVSELSALHTFVYGGDVRQAPDQVGTASLGAVLRRDEAAGGLRVQHVYRADPDRPDRLSPLARPGVDVADGDLIESVNGVAALSAIDPAALLRNQAGRQVLLHVRAGKEEKKGADEKKGAGRDVIVVPISVDQESELRYDEWEYSRRQRVEKAGEAKIGYVHLRAMGGGNMSEWEREFYPVFDRSGLIIDVRHNRGGNIDSWILEKLMRRAWFYWQPRVGTPYWNMQYAFRGHMVVLCDEGTASDGEAFSEGFRRLGLGKVIGTRTWGGEIWLSASNRLVDKGIATAAEFGVYGPEGTWLIEGHGVDPDIVVDNLPHATFEGGDAQLDAAVKYLLEEIRTKPIPVPPPPAYPDKSFKSPARSAG
ncbi:MAG TPA: S41 family peptidase [Patescibacteria group bacterium]|nr:S41 family peptidase [Patescibacteria group bacterium]